LLTFEDLTSVVIVARKWPHLRTTLETYFASTAFEKVETILLFSGINETSDAAKLRGFAQEHRDRLIILDHPQNIGLYNGTNIGWRIARGEVLVSAVDDMTFYPGWLDRSRRALQHMGPSVVGLYHERKVQHERKGRGAYAPEVVEEFESDVKIDRAGIITQIMATTRKVVGTIGLFYSDGRTCSEDQRGGNHQWSRRCEKKGIRKGYLLDSPVIHFHRYCSKGHPVLVKYPRCQECGEPTSTDDTPNDIENRENKVKEYDGVLDFDYEGRL